MRRAGEYDHVWDRDENGVLVRVFSPLGKKTHGNFALHVCTVVTRFLYMQCKCNAVYLGGDENITILQKVFWNRLSSP